MHLRSHRLLRIGHWCRTSIVAAFADEAKAAGADPVVALDRDAAELLPPETFDLEGVHAKRSRSLLRQLPPDLLVELVELAFHEVEVAGVLARSGVVLQGHERLLDLRPLGFPGREAL